MCLRISGQNPYELEHKQLAKIGMACISTFTNKYFHAAAHTFGFRKRDVVGQHTETYWIVI